MRAVGIVLIQIVIALLVSGLIMPAVLFSMLLGVTALAGSLGTF